nr:hypothetical protein BaRGS_003329 [Batillaria attramentaria]
MKGLLSAVKKQMEFYFGDANINKDRFMKQFVDSSPDGYLPISLFLTFHKIQKLTDSQDVIARALQKSDLLKVSEDRTKVCRTRPVHYMTQEEVDARTVYVEGLPKHADHDWVSSQFASCGRVAYVSLPRYRQTGDIKGFAFVEFETPEEAAKAVEMMNKVPEDVEEGEKLSQSVKTLKNLKYWRNRALKEGIDSSTTDQDPKKKKQKAKQTVPGKQSVDQKDTKDTGEAKKRKRKILDKGDGDGAKKPRKDTGSAKVQPEATEGESGKKKRRKKKKKGKKEPFKLKVMSK